MARRRPRVDVRANYARRELARARKRIRGVRAMYVTSGIAGATGLVIGVVLGGGPIWIGVWSGVIVFTLVGAHQVTRKPFVWTLVLALIWTAIAGIALLLTGPYTMTTILSTLWTLGLWSVLPKTVRAEKIVADDPDLEL